MQCVHGHSQDPVVTPEGHLYSKEAILENLLAQKKAIRKRVVAFEAQQQAASDKVSRRGVTPRRELKPALRGCQQPAEGRPWCEGRGPMSHERRWFVDRCRPRPRGAPHTTSDPDIPYAI